MTILPSSLLAIAVLYLDRRPVLFTADDEIITRRKQRDTPKHGNVPVHRLRRGVRGRGEEAEDEEADQEDHGGAIAGHTPLAERKARRRNGLVAQALSDEAANGKDVRGEKRRHCQGGDGVQGSGRAQVEERDDDTETHGDRDGVERNVPAWCNLQRTGVS